MPMTVVFDANKARKTAFGYEVSFNLAGDQPMPRQVIEVSNLKDLLAKFAEYKAAAVATGLPLKVDFRQHGKDRSRKFPGFDKAGRIDFFTPAALGEGEQP